MLLGPLWRGSLQSLIPGGGGSGVGLKSVHEGSMGGLKCSRKIPVKEFI